MFKVLDKRRLDRTRKLLRSEKLDTLDFRNAFGDQLSMTALLINMTASFTSLDEYRRITNHCGSAPATKDRQLNGKNARQRA